MNLHRLTFGRLSYHHILALICVVIVVLTALVTAGCSSTSPGIPDLYVVKLRSADFAFSNLAAAALEVRVGYFGICLAADTTSPVCSSSLPHLQHIVQGDVVGLRLLSIAADVKDKVLFPYFLIIAAVLAFLVGSILATFPNWHTQVDPDTASEVEVKAFPSNVSTHTALALSFATALVLLISTLWQHVAAVATGTLVSNLSGASVEASIGIFSTVLVWTVVLLSVVVFTAVLVTVMSIWLLDALVAE